MDRPTDPDTDLGPETGTDTDQTDRPNLSTDHQQKGDARLPKDTLDRDQGPGQDDGGRKSSFLHND